MNLENWKSLKELISTWLPKTAIVVAFASWLWGFVIPKLLPSWVPEPVPVIALVASIFAALWFMLSSVQETKTLAEEVKKCTEEVRDFVITKESREILDNLSAVHTDSFARPDDILSQAKEIRMAAINFFGLNQHRDFLLRSATENRTPIQIALLRPGCLAFQQHMLDAVSDEDRDRDCQLAVGVIATLRSIQAAIDKSDKKNIPAIELYYYTCDAFCGLVITDSLVRYWPYLHGTVVTNSPTFDFPRTSKHAAHYNVHFDSLMQSKISLADAENVAKDWCQKWRDILPKSA